MEFIRIGEKIIGRERLLSLVSEILKKRSKGATQAEVASFYGVERSFVSYLEGLGEIRRGKRVALVGFPIANKEEVRKVAQDSGVDFVYLLSEKERHQFVEEKSGVELFNEVLEVLARLKGYGSVVFLASDWRTSAIEKILDREVVSIPIGRSPIKKDVHVDTDEVKRVLTKLVAKKRKRRRKGEKSRKRKLRIFKKKSRGPSQAVKAKV